MQASFQEEQKFGQWWLWLLLLGAGFLPVIGIYQQIILGKSFGNKPMSNVGLVFFTLFVALLIFLFWRIRLKTRINNQGIHLLFFPFAKKNIAWQDIKRAEVVDYGFVGGWGVRWWTKFGTVYNVMGRIGLAIELKNGKKLLIGTQKKTEVGAIVKQYLS